MKEKGIEERRKIKDAFKEKLNAEANKLEKVKSEALKTQVWDELQLFIARSNAYGLIAEKIEKILPLLKCTVHYPGVYRFQLIRRCQRCLHLQS